MARRFMVAMLAALLGVTACKTEEARATTNDGEPCTKTDDCNSRQCTGGVCAGSDCDGDTDCREGWTCITRGSDPVFSRTRKTCDCGSSCPKASTTEATIAIVDPNETDRQKLRMNEEVTFRAVVSGGPAGASARWSASNSEPSPTTIELGEGLEIRAKLPHAGRWLVNANATSGAATIAHADVTVSVCGTAGAKCNDYDASCCAPTACRNSPAGGQTCQ